MNLHKSLKVAIVCLGLSILTACGLKFGDVIQGRAVAFDEKAQTVSLILDSNPEEGQSDYDILPPRVFKVPTEKSEMGPQPIPGLRMNLNTDKNTITLYNPQENKFETLSFTLVSKTPNVAPKEVQGRELPEINVEKNQITLYSRSQKLLVEIQVTPEQLAKYPEPYQWESGDIIRIYYEPTKDKDQSQALRLMNVTRTNIFNK